MELDSTKKMIEMEKENKKLMEQILHMQIKNRNEVSSLEKSNKKEA